MWNSFCGHWFATAIIIIVIIIVIIVIIIKIMAAQIND